MKNYQRACARWRSNNKVCSAKFGPRLCRPEEAQSEGANVEERPFGAAPGALNEDGL